MRTLLGIILAICKVISFLILTIGYIIYSFFVRIFFRDQYSRRKYYVRGISWCSKQMVALSGTTVYPHGMPPKDKSHLIVSNHLGMFDILILASLRPCLFITSVDMRQTPFLGYLTDIGGSLYVERRNRANIGNEMLEIREALKQGFNVVLFPEATSTNGEQVLPFKKTLMTSAAGTGVPILPTCINYRKVNGEPMSIKWRNSVFWYDDTPFYIAIAKLFMIFSIKVDVDYLQEIICNTEDERQQVAASAQAQVTAKYTPILT